MNEAFSIEPFVPADELEFLRGAIESKYFTLVVGILVGCREKNLSLEEIRWLYQEHGTTVANVNVVFDILIAIDRLEQLGYGEQPKIEGLAAFVSDPNMHP